MEIKKIFELRAETRTERSLGCQMTIAKEKFGRSAKPAARRGPKPVKNGIFEAIKKKEKLKKSLQNWLESQEGRTRLLPKGFFLAPGGTLGGVLPP